MRILVEIASNRIIWFTDGNEKLVCAPGTAITDYLSPWPAEITLKNCYNYVLRDRKLVKLDPVPVENLHDTNKKHAIDLLRRKINRKRKNITKDMLFEETIQAKVVASAREFTADGTSSWILTRLAAIWEVELPTAAQRVLNEWTTKERMLLQTESQLAEYLHRIENTKNSDEVLNIHAEIVNL